MVVVVELVEQTPGYVKLLVRHIRALTLKLDSIQSINQFKHKQRVGHRHKRHECGALFYVSNHPGRARNIVGKFPSFVIVRAASNQLVRNAAAADPRYPRMG